MMKPFAESSLQNWQVIFEVIGPLLKNSESLLEIGSGTGQHAVYISEHQPGVYWQCSDLAENHPGIRQWIEESGLGNIGLPLELDVSQNQWPEESYDAVFSANSVHIMGWPEVEAFISGAARVLKTGGLFLLYGPFNYNGQFTSESNARFDQWLKDRNPVSGVRDFEALNKLAKDNGLSFCQDYEMPANNRILHWVKV